jgi:tryptophan halogenase
MPVAIRSVVVVGGGVAGWLAAAALARAHAGSLRIQVLELERDPRDSFLVATRPDPVLHQRLGLDDRRLVQAAAATFSTGARFIGWSSPTESYFMPHGQIGARLENVEFHQHLRRLNDLGGRHRLEDYSICALAARQKRFAHPADDLRSVTATLDHGLRVDPDRYAAYLRTLAMRVGVAAVSGRFAAATRRADGAIDELVLEDGSRLRADLYVDCSGDAAYLIGQALGMKFESWRQWLPSQWAVVTRLPADADAAPASTATAEQRGWRWRAPLQTHVIDAFFPDSVSDAEAGLAMKLSSGRRERFWVHNCVALGGAGWFLEPLGEPGLRLLLDGIGHFIALFPNQPEDDRLAREFDRQMGSALDRARDMGALHHARRRTGSLPEELSYKLDVFRKRGKLVIYDDELFSEAEWISAFLGLGFAPSKVDVLSEQHDPAHIEQMLSRIGELMRAAVSAMPPHMAYVSRFASAR